MSGMPPDSASAPLSTYRIAHIALDEETILWRNADVEQERRVAIYDLIESNSFHSMVFAIDPLSWGVPVKNRRCSKYTSPRSTCDN